MTTEQQQKEIEQKLRTLYDLQLIDSRIDEIRNLRGELPLEVQDLEQAIAEISSALERNTERKSEVESEISNQKNKIEECELNLKKYDERLKVVRNAREHDSIVNEQEYQNLEINLANKNIDKLNELILNLNEKAEELELKLGERKGHLESKQGELDEILKDTEKEEEVLLQKSNEFSKVIDEDLRKEYYRIRNNFKNGLAIVSLDDRGAAGGSYFTIPPQLQLEIETRTRIIKDEYSGRILVDPTLAHEEQQKIQSIINLGKL